MRQIGFLLSFLLAVSIIFSCTEPTLIGSELLEEDRANLNFKNDIPLTVKTVNGTPVPTYSPFITLQLNRFLLGQLEDPIFGTSTASVYSQLAFLGDRPVTKAPTIDSVILSLAYDTIGNYGDLSQPIELEVLRVQEDIATFENYTSEQSFVSDPIPIGKLSFVPSFDSVQVADYRGDEPVFTTEPAHVRIPINTEVARELFAADTMVYQSDTTFKQFFKGLHIRTPNPTAGVVAFRFDRAISRLSVYYSSAVSNDSSEYRFPFIFTDVRTSHFTHETQGAAIENSMDTDNADFLYLQGMAGSNIEVSFPDLSSLENVVVNKAELEFTVASNENLDQYPIVPQLIASSVVNAERAVIDDVRAALIGQNPLNSDVFGGVPVTENNITTYRINISDHFQDILEGGKTNSIIIGAGAEESIYYNAIGAKATRANRVILYGPSHPTLSPKLNLTFTTL